MHTPLQQRTGPPPQSLPHVPQSPREELRFVSQPLAALPSQSSKPTLHVATSQVPVAHDDVAFGRAQALPHEPQSASVFKGASQPSAVTPLQFPKPVEQTRLHVPSMQLVPVVLGGEAGQTAPHAPQLFMLEREVSHPFVGSMSQSSQSAAQEAMAQVPDAQTPVALAGAHAAPHAPQFDSVVTLTSQPSPTAPLQSPNPGSHARAQEPLAQAGLA